METTLHFAQNADAGTEESYLRNLPLLKLLAKENIEADDWSVLLAATPNNEDKLLWCLGYTGTLCALDATDFDDWVVYCSTVVLSALEACGVEAPDERKNLLSIGLAARTFNFSGNPVTKKSEMCRKRFKARQAITALRMLTFFRCGIFCRCLLSICDWTSTAISGN